MRTATKPTIKQRAESIALVPTLSGRIAEARQCLRDISEEHPEDFGYMRLSLPYALVDALLDVLREAEEAQR